MSEYSCRSMGNAWKLCVSNKLIVYDKIIIFWSNLSFYKTNRRSVIKSLIRLRISFIYADSFERAQNAYNEMFEFNWHYRCLNISQFNIKLLHNLLGIIH